MFTKFFSGIRKDTRGQDLIEYALLAGFVAVAVGAIMPWVVASISTIIAKVGCAIDGGTWDTFAKACQLAGSVSMGK